MELVRFFALVVQIAIALAFLGQLKSCTLDLLGFAAQKSDQGMISYTKFTHALTTRKER